MVADDPENLAAFLKLSEYFSCKGAVNLESVDERGDCEDAVCFDVLEDLFLQRLVHNDGMLGLVLDLALGPE